MFIHTCDSYYALIFVSRKKSLNQLLKALVFQNLNLVSLGYFISFVASQLH